MQSAHTLSVGFLLGSGVSLPAAPGTELLTDIVLNKVDQYYIHTDEEWYPRPSSGIGAERHEREARVARLIENLAGRVEQYYGTRLNPGGCPTWSGICARRGASCCLLTSI
jgi:hypothetical protein